MSDKYWKVIWWDCGHELDGMQENPCPTCQIATLKAERDALVAAARAEVEALSYVDHKGVRHITHPTTRALAALLPKEEQK